MHEASEAFLKMHIHKHFPFQQSHGVKMHCLKSTVYNLHKVYNVQILRKYINF